MLHLNSAAFWAALATLATFNGFCAASPQYPPSEGINPFGDPNAQFPRKGDLQILGIIAHFSSSLLESDTIYYAVQEYDSDIRPDDEGFTSGMIRTHVCSTSRQKDQLWDANLDTTCGELIMPIGNEGEFNLDFAQEIDDTKIFLPADPLWLRRTAQSDETPFRFDLLFRRRSDPTWSKPKLIYPELWDCERNSQEITCYWGGKESDRRIAFPQPDD